MALAALGWNERRQHEFEPFAAEGLVPGRVIGEQRTHYRVATEAAEFSVTLAGRLRNAAKQRSDLSGVGDFVALRLAVDDGPATIEAVLPRTSALIRKAAGERRPQLLAANVDVVLIVMALDGDFNPSRLERYLALVQVSGAAPVVIANKTDLSDDLMARIGEIREAAPGAPVHAISARSVGEIGQLEQYFSDNRTVALIGSSGVGKSTLTNQLLGEAVQATQEVRAHDNRGRHTTTHRQLFLRPQGGSIMDTPGMRGLELWETDENFEPNFENIERLSRQCRFRNCQHGKEPSCAVRAAVENGQLDSRHLVRFTKHLSKARR
jgi:ribosome biogenesis GTPase